MHLGAHAVDIGRLYATQRILGIISVIWALCAGVFLFLGMNRRMSSPAWQPLLQVTHSLTTAPTDHGYRVIGAVLFAGGLLGLIGLALTARWVSLLSAAVCAGWCAVVAGFLGMSNVNVEGGGNFSSLTVAFIGVVYIVRFVLLVREPKPEWAVQLYERG